MKLDISIQIEVCPGVYAPEEDSYLLLSAIDLKKAQRVLEMGCGTGIIALHCAKAGCRATAADISKDAVANMQMNAAINNLDIEVLQSDMFENIGKKFDIIIFSPPYLSARDSEGLSEGEKRPLVGGGLGHEITARFLDGAAEHLAPGGKIFLLTSSESEVRVLEKASTLFSINKVIEKRIFFELLAVYEMKLGKP